MNNENNIKEISSDLNKINKNCLNPDDTKNIEYINQEFYDSKEYPIINIENEINNTVHISGDKLIVEKNFDNYKKYNKKSNNFDFSNNLENNEKISLKKKSIINDTSILYKKITFNNEGNPSENVMKNNKFKTYEENCLINSEAMNSEKLFSQYNEEFETNNRKSSLKKKILGFFILLFVVLLIVSSSILIKSIETNTKPFLLTYLGYNFFIIYLVIDLIKNLIIKCKQKYNSKESEDEYFEIKYNTKDESKFSHVMERLDSGVEYSYGENFANYTIILCLLWYTTNACYNYALTLTSVTTVNSLSASNIIFVLIFEYLFLIKFSKRKSFFSIFKILGACFSLVGIVLITVFNFESVNDEEKKTNSNNYFGVLLGLCSAIVYASYSIYFKLQTKKYKEKFNVLQTYGFIGIFNLLIIPIILIIFHFTKIETFSFPKSNEFFYIFINALFGGVICDFLIGYAIWLLSPDAVSFGMTMTIPLSYIFDLFIKKNFEFNFFYFFGIACIIAGFSLIAIDNLKKYFKKKLANTE